MAEALIRGILRSKLCPPNKILASTPRQERCDELAQRHGIAVSTSNTEVAAGSDVLVLAVKPQIMLAVLDELYASLRENTLVVSVAAGVPCALIEAHLPEKTRVVRTMPNTPAVVDAGATAISKGSHATDEDITVAKALFDAVGLSVTLPEDQLDAVTGLSGSGPAYVFLILEALSDAGVKVGLSRRNAQRLATQTVLGSAKLLLETDEHPGRLKDMVTSPGGTAICGLHTLENGGVRTTLINAVEAATERSRVLGETLAKGKK